MSWTFRVRAGDPVRTLWGVQGPLALWLRPCLFLRDEAACGCCCGLRRRVVCSMCGTGAGPAAAFVPPSLPAPPNSACGPKALGNPGGIWSPSSELSLCWGVRCKRSIFFMERRV